MLIDDNIELLLNAEVMENEIRQFKNLFKNLLEKLDEWSSVEVKYGVLYYYS